MLAESEPKRFVLREVGNKWCLFSKKTGKKLGCHDSKEKALRQERAIQMMKHKKAADDDVDDQSPSRVFLTALRNELKGKVPDEILTKAIRIARGRAGGILRGRKRKVTASEFDLHSLCAGQGEKREYAFFMPVQFDEIGDTNWIACLPIPGEYSHLKYGKINITKKRNQNFINNFKKKVYQDEIPIDAEHETKLSGAFGYYRDFRMNDNGSVDALIEWTDRGKGAVNAERFKYFSPEWWDEWQDPMTKEKHSDVLIGGGLTTRPFFKEKAGMRTLLASEASIEMSREGDDSVTFTTQEQGGENEMDNDNEKGFMSKLVDLIRSHSEEEDDELDLKLSSEDEDDDEELKAKEAEEKKAVEEAEAKKAKEEAEEEAKLSEEAKKMTERLKAAEQETSKAREDAKKMREEIDDLKKDAREKRFTETVTSGKWIGKHDELVTLLGTMADKLGEDSKEFKAFVERENAHSERIHSSKLFTELGDGGDTPEEGTPDGALKELNKKATELLEGDKNNQFAGDFNRAFTEAVKRNPELKAIYGQRFSN